MHRKSYRFRKDFPIRLNGRRTVYPGIVFTKKMVAVFVDGCFRHSCLEHGTVPKSNRDYWIPKLRRNVERKPDVGRRLRNVGWSVVRIWEHEGADEAFFRLYRGFKLCLPLNSRIDMQPLPLGEAALRFRVGQRVATVQLPLLSTQVEVLTSSLA